MMKPTIPTFVRVFLPSLLLALSACNETTGQPVIAFTAQAGGVAGIAPSVPFITGSGYAVTLTMAQFHMGAVYLNQYNPESGAGSMPCVLDGIYVAEVFGPLDLDLLSPEMVAFPQAGTGTEALAHTAQIFLLEGDINDPDSSEPVLELAGTAQKGITQWPFTATVSIGENRLPQVSDVSEPGANPICAERIVTPIIPVGGAVTPTNNGQLSVRVDVRHMLDGVDFVYLTDGVSPTPAPPYVIPDQIGTTVSDQLFSGLRSDSNVYAISYDQGSN
jgi:hypothetical protein